MFFDFWTYRVVAKLSPLLQLRFGELQTVLDLTESNKSALVTDVSNSASCNIRVKRILWKEFPSLNFTTCFSYQLNDMSGFKFTNPDDLSTAN